MDHPLLEVNGKCEVNREGGVGAEGEWEKRGQQLIRKVRNEYKSFCTTESNS